MAITKESAQLFERWNRSLQTGDPHAVAGNYAPDGILLPTRSNKVGHNRDEIADYFRHFLEKKPSGRIVESNIRIYGDIAIDSGIYVFRLENAGAVQRGSRTLHVRLP